MPKITPTFSYCSRRKLFNLLAWVEEESNCALIPYVFSCYVSNGSYNNKIHTRQKVMCAVLQ